MSNNLSFKWSISVTSCADGYVARGEGGGEMRECRATLPHRRNFHDVRGRGGGLKREIDLRIVVTFKRPPQLDDTIKIDFVFIFVLS